MHQLQLPLTVRDDVWCHFVDALISDKWDIAVACIATCPIIVVVTSTSAENKSVIRARSA